LFKFGPWLNVWQTNILTSLLFLASDMDTHSYL